MSRERRDRSRRTARPLARTLGAGSGDSSSFPRVTVILRLVGLLGALFVLGPVGCGSSTDPQPDDPPAPILGLAARPGAFVDTLTWRLAREDDFSAYRVSRSRSGGLGAAPADTAMVELGSVFARTDTVWIDPDVSPDHQYDYVVRVVDAAGQESPATSIRVRTAPPEGIAVGLEPRRTRWRVGESLHFTLWVAGAADLHGAVLRLEHGAPRRECRVGAPFGEPTLALCLGSVTGPTELAISGVRGGTVLDGSAVLADLVFAPADTDSGRVVLLVERLLRPDGTPVVGADSVTVRSASWETP